MELTTEQKVIKRLAELGLITKVGEVHESLTNPEYADKILTDSNNNDIIDNEINSTECDHEALTNDEIQEVFDNDEQQT